MQCEKCGAEIAEGKLYCEKCGHGVQIVPDYNPELEERIAMTLEKIVREEFGNYRENDLEDQKKFHIAKNKAVAFCAMTGFLILILGFLIGNHMKHLNSYEYQFTKALEYALKGIKDEALIYYEKALTLDNNRTDICISMADIFIQQKEYTVAENCYLTAIKREQANVDNYRYLINLYEKQGKLQEIKALLEQCPNDDILNAFTEYLAITPAVNLSGGEYVNGLTLVLKVPKKETIHFTLDGSEPTLNSPTYIKPVTLEEGDFHLRAIAVNTKGIISDELNEKYHIKLEVPSIASVFPDSGSYHEPTDIQVEFAASNVAYYTLDGSEPTKKSTKYTRPIPMRLGKFTFRCIVIGSNGKASDIITKEYQLDLQTAYEAPEAISSVRNMMFTSGQTYDLEGHVLGRDGNFALNCNEATMINGNVYYLVNVRFINADGTIEYMDYKYAVNAQNIEEISKATSSSDGVYSFTAPY